MPALLWAVWHVFALWRFYRRFIYESPIGRVWGLADDVYISACFGRSLVQGAGFVWYAGAPRVEGISNPLWSAAIGLLHVLPGFSADRLGAFVLALNGLLLTAAWLLFWSSLRRACRVQPGPWAWALSLPLLPLTCAVSYWSAEGFELALLALLTFALLRAALGSGSSRNALTLAGLLAVGFATRMDFLLLASPALLLYTWRLGPRSGLLALLPGLAAIALLLCLRKAYYGEWLPNTYWLKATGWPLSARLARGYAQNWALLSSLALPWLLLGIPGVRRFVFREVPQTAAAFFGCTLTVLYSTYVGGDSWSSMGGYDRHTAVGGMLLCWGAASTLLQLAPRPRLAIPASCFFFAIAAWPVARTDLPRTFAGVFSADVPLRGLEREWIEYGKTFREVARPGARIAVCPAGAIVYFSERGGVDLLGKVDPFVAHLDVSPRRPNGNVCWRNAPGHNKEDDERTFALREPEFSRYHPPKVFKASYGKVKHRGMTFYVRRGTPYLVEPRD
jgi:hypothetical protein